MKLGLLTRGKRKNSLKLETFECRLHLQFVSQPPNDISCVKRLFFFLSTLCFDNYLHKTNIYELKLSICYLYLHEEKKP